ncbi:phage holin family protein [Nocardioides jishulii]|uniref:Phage holin family protein n=1 Tax=Nocardioides jishulii TaxID=2575440 RepID=A0A4U2YTS9_9ACTN|nr:phage holin family protein [Nocardioides jishulii]QCX28818.1 phage holin family protein [Nocardioides jishulii]TKI64285.1 phage holin family protein [Nocardioides jishulii]
MATEPVQDTDPTIGRLISDASRDFSSLIHQEIELAKSELKVSVKAGGTGIGLFAGAAFMGLMFLVLLSVTIAFFINWNGEGLALHWAFLIVTAFYLVVAGILALVGLRKVKKVKAPERAIRQAQETGQLLKR